MTTDQSTLNTLTEPATSPTNTATLANTETDPRLRTADGVLIQDGLAVWDEDLRPGVVQTGQLPTDTGEHWDGWFRIRRADWSGFARMNGERLRVTHPRAGAPAAAELLAQCRQNRCHIAVFQRAVAVLDAATRRALLAGMGVDEVEALLEHAFLSGDPVYRDQVIDRLVRIDPRRGAGPRQAAAERDAQKAAAAPAAVPALLVAVDGAVEAIELTPAAGHLGILPDLYAALGCDSVEVVALVEGELEMWVDEEGMIGGAQPNPTATRIAADYGYSYQSYYGAAVFTGGLDDDGHTTALCPELAQHLRTLAGAV